MLVKSYQFTGIDNKYENRILLKANQIYIETYVHPPPVEIIHLNVSDSSRPFPPVQFSQNGVFRKTFSFWGSSQSHCFTVISTSFLILNRE